MLGEKSKENIRNTRKNIEIAAIFFAIAAVAPLILTAASVSASGSLACSSSCTTSYCMCMSNCTGGYFNLYSSSDCSGITYKKIIISSSNVNFTTASSPTYGKILCSDDMSVSPCYLINLTTAVTTTTTTSATTTTTTTTTLAACPYDCCVSVPGYQNQYCPTGQLCQNNACVTSKSDCPNDCCVNDPNYNDKFCSDSSATCTNGKCVTPGPQINYYLIGAIAVVIVVGVVGFYFLRDKIVGKKGSSNQQTYDALKKKWGSR